ncbi:MAG: hypothetical protein NkDv07_0566 [Candidatus Improbicoccus devescovinae]|nr:MAG: hypothetical protein NkDv07_0566 [Candidatus Improbicoccus devescovinae]
MQGKIMSEFKKIITFVLFVFLILNSRIIIKAEIFESSISQNQNILGQLNSFEIASFKPMREHLEIENMSADFNGEVYLLTLKNGLEAVFKASDNDDIQKKREVLAFRLSQEFGIGYVPPTVVRNIKINDDEKLGFLSLYKKPDFDLGSDNADMLEMGFQKGYFLAEDFTEMQAFNFIFGKWDVGKHNCLISNKKIISIDNESILSEQYVQYGEIPFVIGQQLIDNFQDFKYEFPFGNAKFCDKQTREEIKQKYGKKVSNHRHWYVIHNGKYWTQYSGTDKRFLYPDKFSNTLAKKIKKITWQRICEIFDEENVSIGNKEKNIIIQVIQRRNLMLKNFGWHQEWQSMNFDN